MQLLERVKTALVLMKDSLLVMRHNPRLLLFPVVSGLAGLVFLSVFLGLTFGVLALDPGGDWVVLAALAGCLLAVYLGTTFISVFFTAALVHQTRSVLAGGEVSLRSGIRGAWRVRAPLFVWAAVAATVGVILSAIEDSNSGVGRVLATIFGVAWTLLTFFIVPVVVFEETSITGMFRESAGTFRETWGETPLSLAGIGLVSLVVMAPFAVPGVLLVEGGQYVAVGIGLATVGVVLAAVVSHTFKGVIKTTLYLYATEGQLPEEFDDLDPDALSRDAPGGAGGTLGPTTGGFR